MLARAVRATRRPEAVLAVGARPPRATRRKSRTSAQEIAFIPLLLQDFSDSAAITWSAEFPGFRAIFRVEDFMPTFRSLKLARWLALPLLLGLPLSCASERAAINRVQANALEKSFFVGKDLSDPTDNPRFFYRPTVV